MINLYLRNFPYQFHICPQLYCSRYIILQYINVSYHRYQINLSSLNIFQTYSTYWYIIRIDYTSVDSVSWYLTYALQSLTFLMVFYLGWFQPCKVGAKVGCKGYLICRYLRKMTDVFKELKVLVEKGKVALHKLTKMYWKRFLTIFISTNMF